MISLANETMSSQRLADLLDITYYTDPLCCWSWGFEPQWRRLLAEFPGKLKTRYCMGGLLPGWKNFHDTLNAVTKPVQMGPVWMHAAQVSGMPIQHNIWVKDPPASSYPACVAVKCAALQSAESEDLYLRLLREGVMIRGENISRKSVLMSAAQRLSEILPSFDADLFIAALENGDGKEHFRKDLQEAQYYRINRFPSLVIRNGVDKAIIIQGYRSYDVLLHSIAQLGLPEKTEEKIDIDSYKVRWPFATTREIEELR